MNIEQIIISHLLEDESFLRKTIPFLKTEYFNDRADQIVFDQIKSFVDKYNARPSAAALSVEIGSKSGLSEDEHSSAQKVLIKSPKIEEVNAQWLLDETEKFCQDRAVYNGIMSSIAILDGRDKAHRTKEMLPEILKAALAVSFDDHVGHDFLEDWNSRYDFYHRTEEKLKFDIEALNKITNGGLSRKSLNIILAGTGVGKSLAMCHMAAANLSMGRRVLYITCEMAEEKIAERIDANLLNVPLDDLNNMPLDSYTKKIVNLRKSTLGKLIIKEYPTASAHTGHFRALLNELNLKRNFIPDVIYIDYLNICVSSRIKQGSNINSYTYIKSIAEELRGLAVEKNVPIISATQTTRSGYQSSDPGLEDTSESFGLPATADFMIALVSTEELENINQIMVKQLKNRYSDPNSTRRFVLGIDKTKMRLYDVDDNLNPLQNIDNNKPIVKIRSVLKV